MSWAALIGAIIKYLIMAWTSRKEKDKQKKEQKENALKEFKQGIKDRDPSKIIVAFDRFNRIDR